MTDLQTHILLVDDEGALREVVAERLRDEGYAVSTAESGERAIALLSDFAYDVVITDLRLPGVDGNGVLDFAFTHYPNIIAIVITGYGTVRDAVEAIKRGAADFVAKPFQFDELRLALGAALEQRRLKAENAYLRSQLEERYRFGGIIGRSRAMRDLFQLLETVASSSSTVLLTGETGTGKEVVARAIHHNSPRRANRFVAINCSAIPETLLEAELFGHVKGAFTGAVGMRQGRFEQAHRGTLFLDEVGTMSPALQSKVLRALQEREFERIGDTQTIKVDVRVIVATNADLRQMVAAGQFREDLYYRLNVIGVTLPPLRDRRDDIPLLVQHFLIKYGTRDSGLGARGAGLGARENSPAADNDPTAPLTISQAALRRLMSYDWPGNIRQLENAIERATALRGTRTQIEVDDLPPEIIGVSESALPSLHNLPDDGLDLPKYIADLERDFIQRSLTRTAGNKHKAAALLGLKRTTMVEKIRRLELGPETGDQGPGARDRGPGARDRGLGN